jgi:tripartite-type tricarboxylate transporter receptor subunit TctC
MGVPRGTPAPIIERLNHEINAGLADPGIQARLAEVGGSPLVYTSSALAEMITKDAEKWHQVIQRAGIQPE